MAPFSGPAWVLPVATILPDTMLLPTATAGHHLATTGGASRWLIGVSRMASAVPVPVAWAMLVGGFGLLALQMVSVLRRTDRRTTRPRRFARGSAAAASIVDELAVTGTGSDIVQVGRDTLPPVRGGDMPASAESSPGVRSL